MTEHQRHSNILEHKIGPIILILLLGWATLMVPTQAQAESQTPLDRIIAVVNDQPITQNQFNRALQRAHEPLHNKTDNINPKQLNHQVMQQLINREIQWQVARQHHITVSDKQVEKVLKTIIRLRYHGHADLFQHNLSQQGITLATYQKDIKKDLIIQKLQEEALSYKIHITKAAIHKAQADYNALQQQHTEFHLRDILLPFKDPDSISDTDLKPLQQAAEQLVKQIRSAPQDAVPEQLATPYGKQAIIVHDLGFRYLNDLPSIFIKKVPLMHLGQVSAPIRTSNGYHLLHLLGRKSPPSPPLTSDQVRQWLWQRQFLMYLSQWMQQLRHQVYIKIIHDPDTT